MPEDSGLIHPSPVLLAGAAVIAQIGSPLVYGTARDTLMLVAITLSCAASVTHAALTRGRRTALVLLGVFGGGSLSVEAIGLATGFPFGHYSYGDRLGPELLGVPIAVGLIWTMMAWPSWIAAGRLTSSRWSRISLAASAMAAWELFLDPQLVAAGYQRWADPDPALPGVYGVPLTSQLGWLAVALLLMAVFDRFGASTDVQPRLDAVPVGLFLWVYASSMLEDVVFFGLPYAALWGALGMGLVAVPLAAQIRGRRG